MGWMVKPPDAGVSDKNTTACLSRTGFNHQTLMVRTEWESTDHSGFIQVPPSTV